MSPPAKKQPPLPGWNQLANDKAEYATRHEKCALHCVITRHARILQHYRVDYAFHRQ